MSQVKSSSQGWKIESFSSVERVEIDWVFHSYVARGKITALFGEPGCGKSLITLDWAARFSTGRGWPDGTPPLQRTGKVLIFATEDDAGDTILPRFIAAGGNPENLLRIHLEGDTGFYFDDPKHLEVLRMVTEQNRDIGMVIIDPIFEHMRADKEQATREAYAKAGILQNVNRPRLSCCISLVKTSCAAAVTMALVISAR